MDQITFCIPSKNNLRYLKSSISSIKNNSSLNNEILVWIDQDNDGTEEWLIKNNIKYLTNPQSTPQGIAVGYNRCIEIASTPIVCMFHADMYMGKGFDLAIIKHIKPSTVVSGTRIEPPLHPKGFEKIVENFGMYPEDFEEQKFNLFVEKTTLKNKDITTNGIFAPWAIYKKDIISIGMHDEKFHSYHEDSDIFNRFILNGYNLIQTWEGLVYHLTCRGGQFQDGVEQITSDKDFHKMKQEAAQNYIKKWGSWIKNNEYSHPILSPVYRKKLILNNSNPNLTSLYDWFNEGDDIIVTIDGNNFTQEDFKYITILNDIISNSGEIGEFKLGNLNIKINKIEDISRSLINN